DEKPQRIETFEYISADARPPDDERSTMLTPREGLELAADPHYRVFVIVIDKAAIVKSTWEPLRKALHEFLDSEVSPRDLIGLVPTGGSGQGLVIGKRVGGIEEGLRKRRWRRREAKGARLVSQRGTPRAPRLRSRSAAGAREVGRHLHAARESRARARPGPRGPQQHRLRLQQYSAVAERR